MRRADGLRPPAVGVLTAALVLAGIVVLLVVGLWASRLGDSPERAWDCNDTTCTDLWVDARGHYLRVAAGAGLTTLLGAALCSVALPRQAVPRREGSRRALLRLIAPMLLAAVMLWGALWLALAVSRPVGLAVALLALLLATLTAWRWQRPGAESDRTAYLSAGLGVIAPALVGGVLAFHPLGLLAAVLLLDSPWLGAVVPAFVLLAGSALTGRLLPRTEDVPRAGDRAPSAPGGSARSRLYWPGYRTAADQETPQTLTVRTDALEVPVTVSFLPTSSGDDPGPAPFDLQAGVEGGAVIEIGSWEASPSPEG